MGRLVDLRPSLGNFTIWGWQFHVVRQPTEFLTLRSVTCHTLTMEGSGQVTVTVPASCRTGRHRHATFTVNLGGPSPVDEPAGLGALPVYGRTVTISLS